jgi:hypothetical protein
MARYHHLLSEVFHWMRLRHTEFELLKVSVVNMVISLKTTQALISVFTQIKRLAQNIRYGELGSLAAVVGYCCVSK